MKKKAIAESTLVRLIAFVVVLGVALIIFFNINKLLEGETNKETISNWVMARGVFKGVITPIPPVSDLSEPLEIEDEEDLLSQGGKPPKAFEGIANSMADCWTAFDRGQTDFLNNIQKDVFCFPCQAIVFSDDIKRDQIKMIGFNNYLNDTHTRGEDSPTYLQFLANDNDLVLEQQELSDDQIIADKNLYVYFFAASGRGLVNIITNVLGVGDVVPEGTEQERTYSPTEVSQPQYGEISGLTASEEAELSLGTAGGLTAGRYVVSISEGFAKEASEDIIERVVKETTQTVVEEAPTLVPRGAGIHINGVSKFSIELAEAGGRTTTTTVTRETVERTAKKAAEKTFKKSLAKIGAKIISGPIGWGLTVAAAGYGTYQVIWGEKPFIAKVMIVEPDKVYGLCNA